MRSRNATIGVIDDIAFQTNLLALNAGVEVASRRRSRQGLRGCRLVRCANWRSVPRRPPRIKLLITTSENQVNTGVVLVGETGAEALVQIEAEVTEITAHSQRHRQGGS